jgi:hypothetical protein
MMRGAMDGLIKKLGELSGSGPNRIALSTAMRGTIATALPLLLLPQLGLGHLTYPAVLGALATSMVDVGGPYRARLLAMLAQALGGPCLLLLGSAAVEHWWLAALVMAAIGVVSGLIRALGPGGAALGVNSAIAFLVGLQVGEIGSPLEPWAVGYGAGGLWTILVALVFWQLRPYRRLEQEVASAWEAVASLVATIGAEQGSVVARRRREQRIAAAHAAVRNAVERARTALGETRAGTAGPGTTMAQLVVLLTAAARIAAAAVTLSEVAAPPGVSGSPPRPNSGAPAGPWRASFSPARENCRSPSSAAGSRRPTVDAASPKAMRISWPGRKRCAISTMRRRRCACCSACGGGSRSCGGCPLPIARPAARLSPRSARS